MDTKKIKVALAKPSRLDEGVYLGTVSDIDPDRTGVVMTFKISHDSSEYEVNKEYPETIDAGSTWIPDIEKLTGKPISARELGAEFDLNQLMGKSAPVVVMHKRGQGGRPVAVVSVVLSNSFQFPPHAAERG